MLPNIIMTSIQYQQPQHANRKVPRARYMQYYKDLYQYQNKKITEESFYEGSQFTYAELCDAVLSPYEQQGKLNNIDLLMFAYWAYEFDPDYASCGAYVCYKYQLNCKMFDVSEQGSIAPFTAIKLIISFIKNTDINKALLLILEQTTIPHVKAEHVLIPETTGAIAMLLEREKPFTLATEHIPPHDRDNQHPKYRVMLADILPILFLPENPLANPLENSQESQHYYRLFMNFIDDYLSKINNNANTDIFIRKKSRLWTLFNYYSSKLPKHCHLVDNISNEIGCLQPFIAIYAADQQPADSGAVKNNIVVLDEDVESHAVGIIILSPSHSSSHIKDKNNKDKINKEIHHAK